MRLFQEHLHEIQSIISTIGCTAQTLSTWVQRAEVAADPRRNAALAERQRVKKLQREVTELRRENAI